MSVFATIEVPAEDFTLGGALTPNPGIRVSLDRVVPLGSTLGSYLWATDGSLEAIEAALRAEDDIESFRVVDTVNDEVLVRVKWRKDFSGLLDVLTRTGASVLEGEGGAGSWRFRLRFDDHDSLTAFYHRCVERGIDLDVKSIHNARQVLDVSAEDGLTDAQRETMRIACERGYFDVPRQVTLTHLAEELGISDTAVSQRIRRGLSNYLTPTLAVSDAPSWDR